MPRRDLTSQIDGVVVSFTTPEAFRPGTLAVSRNGIDLGLPPECYQETGANTFTLSGPPAQVGEELVATYYMLDGTEEYELPYLRPFPPHPDDVEAG